MLQKKNCLKKRNKKETLHEIILGRIQKKLIQESVEENKEND